MLVSGTGMPQDSFFEIGSLVALLLQKPTRKMMLLFFWLDR